MEPQTEMPRAVRVRRTLIAVAAGSALVAAVLVLARMVDYFGAALALGVLAFLGAAAGVGAVVSADSSKGQTIGGALTTAALLAFCAFALSAATVLR